ncbi:MAG: hypothetical protein RRY34_04595 [Victivallaceae bacterium]
MKIKFWISLCLFISSYFPLAIIWTLLDFDYQQQKFSHPIWLAILNAISLFCVLISGLTLYLPRRLKRSTRSIKISAAQEHSAELLNYSLPYIISFYAVKLGDFGTISALSFFMAILFMLSYLSKIILLNPFFLLLGYQLYEVTYSNLGYRQLRQQLLWSNINPIPINSAVDICQISDNFIILTNPNPEV